MMINRRRNSQSFVGRLVITLLAVVAFSAPSVPAIADSAQRQDLPVVDVDYEDKCRDAGKKCPVIPYFSNPDLSYKGEALGVPIGQDGEANAVGLIDKSARTVANYGGAGERHS